MGASQPDCVGQWLVCGQHVSVVADTKVFKSARFAAPLQLLALTSLCTHRPFQYLVQTCVVPSR